MPGRVGDQGLARDQAWRGRRTVGERRQAPHGVGLGDHALRSVVGHCGHRPCRPGEVVGAAHRRHHVGGGGIAVLRVVVVQDRWGAGYEEHRNEESRQSVLTVGSRGLRVLNPPRPTAHEPAKARQAGTRVVAGADVTTRSAIGSTPLACIGTADHRVSQSISELLVPVFLVPQLPWPAG